MIQAIHYRASPLFRRCKTDLDPMVRRTAAMRAKEKSGDMSMRGDDRSFLAFRRSPNEWLSFAVLLTGILTIVICCSSTGAQTAYRQQHLKVPTTTDSSGTTVPDISGMWMLLFDGANVPRAQLNPSVTASDLLTHARMDALAMRWCNYVGTPFLMQSRFPLDIRQGRMETIIAAAEVSTARHIYTDGRGHVRPDEFEPTTNGDSIGQWEGDALVVDTVSFSPSRGLTSIPGGGFKTATSHLVERYQLTSEGAKLSVTFSWTDPNVYAAPHTYGFLYTRAPKGTWARKVACDPFDASRTQFLSEAPK